MKDDNSYSTFFYFVLIVSLIAAAGFVLLALASAGR